MSANQSDSEQDLPLPVSSIADFDPTSFGTGVGNALRKDDYISVDNGIAPTAGIAVRPISKGAVSAHRKRVGRAGRVFHFRRWRYRKAEARWAPRYGSRPVGQLSSLLALFLCAAARQAEAARRNIIGAGLCTRRPTARAGLSKLCGSIGLRLKEMAFETGTRRGRTRRNAS